MSIDHPLPPRRTDAVPAGWAAANPVDDDEPPPPARAFAAAPPVTSAPRPRGTVRPAAGRPPAGPAAAPVAAPRPRPAGAGRAGDPLTGRPRVDWGAYDAQAAEDFAADPTWVLYRAWTTVPIDGRWWVRAGQRILSWLIGPRFKLIYIGISVRAGIARATEHLALKDWRREVHIFEVDQSVLFSSEADAERYEEERIRAECPRYNKQHNERAFNPGAAHRTKRIQAHHVAGWREQAGLLALVWWVLSALCTWILMPEIRTAGSVLGAIGGGIMLAATLMQLWRLAGLFLRGQQLTTAQRNRIKAKFRRGRRKARPKA